MYNVIHKLSSDFCVNRYGVECRLVQESDAEFIYNLRKDSKLSRYIHQTRGLEDQQNWIKDYKTREQEGTDYYFIFILNGNPYGLARIYNINWARLSCIVGSWLCKPDIPMDKTFITNVILEEIRDAMGLLIELYDVRKENKSVLNFHRKILCAYEYGETNRDILFISTPETRGKSRLRNLLDLPPNIDIESIPTVTEQFDY